MDTIRKIKMILTLTCDESSRLASDDLERPLGLAERIALQMHVLICKSCRRFRRQIHLLHKLLRDSKREAALMGPLDLALTPAERGRILAAVHQARRENS